MYEDDKMIFKFVISGCSETNKYMLAAIKENDESTGVAGKAYNVFLTEKEVEANNPFATIRSEENIRLLLLCDSDARDLVCDLGETGIYVIHDDVNYVVLGNIIEMMETSIRNNEFDRAYVML